MNSPLWKRLSRVEIRRQQENQYKGDSNEHFKQSARVGCNRTSRKTCRKDFKKEQRAVFGRDAKESESGRACRSIWSIALYRSRRPTNVRCSIKTRHGASSNNLLYG